jgi:hypothetical protein
MPPLWELLQERRRVRACFAPAPRWPNFINFAQQQSDTKAALETQRVKRKLLGRVKGKQTA